jgi:hypothetical protein
VLRERSRTAAKSNSADASGRILVQDGEKSWGYEEPSPRLCGIGRLKYRQLQGAQAALASSPRPVHAAADKTIVDIRP